MTSDSLDLNTFLKQHFDGEIRLPNILAREHWLYLILLRATGFDPDFTTDEGEHVTLEQLAARLGFTARPQTNVTRIVSFSLQPLDSQNISHWSCGEVKIWGTYVKRTGQAKRYGLFDEKIFGPREDGLCPAMTPKERIVEAIFRRIDDIPIRHLAQRKVCPRCQITHDSAARQARFGHIVLAEPFAHPWFPEQQITVLPVIPPTFRPQQIPEKGPWPTHDLTYFYQGILSASGRLRDFRSIAPDSIIEVYRSSLRHDLELLFLAGFPGHREDNPRGIAKRLMELREQFDSVERD